MYSDGKVMKFLFMFSRCQGYPEFLQSYACDTYFEWFTTVACKVPLSTGNESKCYTYKDGKKFDLTPLIKDYYRVETDDENLTMYINVCRDLSLANLPG